MLTIFKYPLRLTDHQQIAMPEGAEVLTAQWQHDKIVVWARVDTEAPERVVAFTIIGTGNTIYEQSIRHKRYVATVQEPTRPLVWHVFVGFTKMTGV